MKTKTTHHRAYQKMLTDTKKKVAIKKRTYLPVEVNTILDEALPWQQFLDHTKFYRLIIFWTHVKLISTSFTGIK